VDKALTIFLSLIKEDIDFVINTDPVDDDCPCPELVFNMEHGNVSGQQTLDSSLVLGMLWLYCNLHKSYEYFAQASNLDNNDKIIKSILALLDVRLKKENASV
jgi:hypothetical protein